MSVSDQTYRSPMGLQTDILVSDQSLTKQVGLRSDLSVSDGSPTRHISFRSVSDQASRSPIIILFSWTRQFGGFKKILFVFCFLSSICLDLCWFVYFFIFFCCLAEFFYPLISYLLFNFFSPSLILRIKLLFLSSF